MTDTEQTTEQASEENTEEGKAPVDMSPEVQARFNRVYGNMKQWERIAEERIGTERKLHDRIEQLEKARSEEASKEQITTLRTAEKEALESGEYDRATEVRDQITDIKVDAKIPKAKPVEEEPEQWLTPDRAAKIEAWGAEKDDKGELLRPWADPAHAEHQTAITTIQVLVAKDPNIELDELLEKADKVNGRLVKRTAAQVLSGGSNVRPKDKKITLSEDEKLVARKMYPDDPKAVERYTKAKERTL